MRFVFAAGLALATVTLVTPSEARAQALTTADVTPCPAPVKQPPKDSPVLLRCMEFRMHPSNETVTDYQFYVKSQGSRASEDKWSPFKLETVQADFWTLWNTKFLDNLWIEIIDEPYDNGVLGKHVIFHMEERSRVKIVDYTGSKKVDVAKIEEAMKDKEVEIRIDSFIDDATIRKVKGIIQGLYAERGYQYAEVTPVIAAASGGPKIVHLTFHIKEGPKVTIGQIQFEGNTAFTDAVLRNQLKENKTTNFLSFIVGGASYQEAKWDEDAQHVLEFYRERGYVQAKVGAPQIEVIGDTKTGKNRRIRIVVPVDEGPRYRIGSFNLAGNEAIKTDVLRKFFKLNEGEYYNQKTVSKALEKIGEAYNSGGFMDFSPDYDFAFRGIDPATGQPIGNVPPPNIVDVTIRINEGKRYMLNRMTFTGNSTTHDNVIRREMRLAEGDVFNMEALKMSIRRLNQLGYFKPLDGQSDVQLVKTPDAEGKMDVKLKFQEQNRNQISFGAGVSQFEGFFGQLSFQTANFLGRGETLSVSAQKGSIARNYQVAFTEPFLFDRPITAGIDVYSREYVYPSQFTQQSTGGNLLVGFPLSNFTRMYTGYSYEQVRVKDINAVYLDPTIIASSPYLADTLLLNRNGRRDVGKISPSLSYNSVNQPVFPDSGQKHTFGFNLAGIGGDTYYWTLRLENLWYVHLNNHNSIGLHFQADYLQPYGSTTTVPISEKFFLGGEYSIRGFDQRTVSPRDKTSGVIVGGNKSILFNAEYVVNVGGPVRVLGFFDAGQVRDLGERFVWKEDISETRGPTTPLLYDPLNLTTLTEPGAIKTVVTGTTSGFRVSTGFELRFFMPVLNVPFRFIAAYNPARYGILNNNGLLTKRFVFKFAVGTTF